MEDSVSEEDDGSLFSENCQDSTEVMEEVHFSGAMLDSEEWDEQEAKFRRRTRELFTLSMNIQDSKIDEFLWKQELSVRRLLREQVLLRHLAMEAARSERGTKQLQQQQCRDVVPPSIHVSNDDNTLFLDALNEMDPASAEMQHPQSVFLWLRFEWKTTVPTFYNAILFAWAMLAVGRLVNRGKQCLMLEDSSGVMPFLFYTTLALVGCVMFCCTPFFFGWFSSEHVYQCFNIYLENGIYLKKWHARIIAWMEGNLFWNIVAYMVAYTLVQEPIIVVSNELYFLLAGSSTHWTIWVPYLIVTLAGSVWFLTQRGVH